MIKVNPNSMLPSEAFAFLHRWMLERLESGYVVELGSGHGSAALAHAIAPLELISIEHDERFIGLVEGTTYIHAPIWRGWYDENIVARCLPARADIRALVVDGPPAKIGRAGLLPRLHLFGVVPILFDDVHRPAELELASEIARRRAMPAVVHQCGERAFATVGFE